MTLTENSAVPTCTDTPVLLLHTDQNALAEFYAPDVSAPGMDAPKLDVSAPEPGAPVGINADDFKAGADVPKMDASAPGADLSLSSLAAPKMDPSDIPLAAAAAGGLGAVGAAGAGIAAATVDKPKKSGFGRLFSRKNKKSSESTDPLQMHP